MKKPFLNTRSVMRGLLSLAFVASLGSIVQTAQATQTNLYKMDTFTMNTTNDWSFANTAGTTITGGAFLVSGSSNICNINAILSASNAANMMLGGNIQMDCLQVGSGLAGPLTITNDGNTLTLGTPISTYYVGLRETAGIGYNITIDCPIMNIGNNQRGPFTLQANRTVTLNGPLLASTVNNDGGMLLNGQGGTGNQPCWLNINGGGLCNGTYFGAAYGVLNISGSNLTVSNNYNFVCGYGNSDNEINISNCVVSEVGTAGVLIGGGYNGAATTGTGTVSVGGTNGAPGELVITKSGTFKIGVANSATASGTGTLNLNGYGTVSTARALTANTLANSAFVNFNGGTLQLAASQGNLIGAGFTVTVLDGGATIDTETYSTAIVPALLSGGTGIGGLTKLGTGTLTLANSSAWGGPTAINGGELVVSTLGFANSTSDVTVAAGATNGVQKVSGGITWNVAGLAYAAGNTWLDVNFSAPASTLTAPITVSGNLAINGTLNVIVRGTALWASGTYPLIQYTGALSLTGSLPATPVTLPAGVVGTIVNDPAHKSIDLVVTTGNGAPPQVLTWVVGNDTWDINSTANWDNINGTLVTFLNGESVLFNDGATGTSPFAVELDSTVNPAGITVNDTLASYTIQGSGTIAGTNAMVKSGTGSLILGLNNGNTYSGGTYVNAGTLQISADNNLGAPNAPLYVGPDPTATLYASNGEVDSARPVEVLTNGTFKIDNQLDLTNGYTSSLLTAGTVNVIGGGTLELPASSSVINSCYVAVNNATVQLDGGTVNAYQGFTVGNSIGSVAMLTVNSGTFNLTNTAAYTTNYTYLTNNSIITTNLVIGTNYTSGGFTMCDSSGVNSTFNINGGAVNFATKGGQLLLLGNRSLGTINVFGGIFHINSDPQIWLGGHPVYNNQGASGTLNIQGLNGPASVIVDPSSQFINVGTLNAGQGFTVTTGTINLSTGGTLATGRAVVGGNATSFFHFNGGTLKALANSTNFLQNLTAADIALDSNGNGAIVDDGGFVISIPQPLADAGGGCLTKNGIGTLYLDATNTYAGPTVATAGTLGGSGTLGGDLILSNNAALAPGDAGIPGVLTVGGNLSFNGNVLVKVNTSLTPANDQVAVTGTLTNTGTGFVIVTNLGPTLTVGQQFYLFSQPVPNGNALTVTGGGATWTNHLAVDGSITVQTVLPTVSTNAATANFKATAASGALSFTWAPDHLGWQLYTNAVGLTATNSWFPVAGSAAVTSESITINPANAKIFFQLRYP